VCDTGVVTHARHNLEKARAGSPRAPSAALHSIDFPICTKGHLLSRLLPSWIALDHSRSLRITQPGHVCGIHTRRRDEFRCVCCKSYLLGEKFDCTTINLKKYIYMRRIISVTQFLNVSHASRQN